MVIKRSPDIPFSEITPKDLYLNRRKFMSGIGMAWAGAIAGRFLPSWPESGQSGQADAKLNYIKSNLSTQGEELTPYKAATTYNNFYEFGTDKEDPARNSAAFRPRPWTISIEGLVKEPRKFDVEALLALHPSLEERVYRMRCVEAWSMVIPWIGIPLRSVIQAVQPASKTRFVIFETLYDAKQMPGQRRNVLPWPYTEGLRLDEALHPLTILAAGMYGEALPAQNGSPIRLVVPWKYGFKSIKSIVKIRFVENQPSTSWNMLLPSEYGFYANVNPGVDHPRWSQKSERRIGDFFKRKTLMFNGYGDQVASLYSGMDLQKLY